MKVFKFNTEGNFYTFSGATEEEAFKFNTEGNFYTFSGATEEEAKTELLSSIGEIDIVSVDEIPESEWDKETINIWEDNDRSKKPSKISIRDIMYGDCCMMICTNDIDYLD